MMHDATRVRLAAQRLTETFDDHRVAIQEQGATRDKLGKLEKLTSDLLTSIFGDSRSRANSVMLGYQQRFRILKGTLTRNAARIEKTRAAFESDLDTFEKTLDNHRSLLTEQANATQVERRANAANLRVLNGLLDQMLDQSRPEIADLPNETPPGSHPYIAYPIMRFHEIIVRLEAHLSNDPDFVHPEELYRPVRFLEIGSGPGRNLFMLKLAKPLLIRDLTGFDLNQAMIALGRLAFGLTDELQVADALSFDYGGYDVLFSYRPILVPEIQAQLESRIAETMDTGAYLLAPMAEDLARYPQLERVGYPFDIWKKTG